MATLIGGVVAIILGVILGVIWWFHVLSLLGGAVPILLILGGGIAIYLGIDELRYPMTKAYPSAEPETTTPPEGAVEPKAPETTVSGKPSYWLIGYTARNVELVREHGIISVPSERSEVIEKMMNTGDRVILYALSPESQFGGIVEVTGEANRSANIPLEPAKEGERWEVQREIRPIVLPANEKWVDARPLLEDLELLEDARKEGKTLVRSFAAKLREIPRLSSKDYGRIAGALGV